MAIASLPSGPPKSGFFSRRRTARLKEARRDGAPRRRTLQASARPIQLRDRVEARRLRTLRHGWQMDAFAYAKNVPEIDFAMRFLTNCAKRIRVMPMAVNPEDPDGAPITLVDAGFPQQVIESCAGLMDALGVGRIAKAPLMEGLCRGFNVPGECWMVGMTDPDTGLETWKIRSIQEIRITDEKYQIREIPMDPNGEQGWDDLDPDQTFLSRMWVPDNEFAVMAHSPMRPLLDTCEELLLLGRDVRAVARSRLASAGFLKIPEGLRIRAFLEDNNDPQADEFIGQLTTAMMTPIAEEGTAGSVVPIGVSGEVEALNAFQHLVIDRPYSPLAMEQRTEAIGRIANGLDVPRAIVLGLEDVNHWGAWQISDDTFRHHVEPGTITQVDALTMGFLRPGLTGDEIDPYWVERAVMWYDPVELVTHPDQTSDAITLYNMKEISGKALRKVTGFTEEDKPDPIEVVTRAVSATKTWPPNALLAILARLDPSLSFPPITTSGTFPGIKAGSVEAAPPALPPGAPSALPVGPGPTGPSTGDQAAPPEPTPSATATPAAPVPGPPEPADDGAAAARAEKAFAAFAAKANDRARRQRLSRKLTEIDSVLRAKVHTAACGAMVRVLEKAGAKLRTTANGRKFKDGIAKGAIAETPNVMVAATLGRSVVAAMGFPDSYALLATDWADLRDQFYSWVETAQKQAVAVAAQLAGLSPRDPKVARTLEGLKANTDAAWTALAEALSKQAEEMLYNPAPNAPNPDETTYNPATVVSAGIVRRAIGIAGGSGKTSAHKAVTAAADAPNYPEHLLGDNAAPGADPWAVDPTKAQPDFGSAPELAAASDMGEIGTGADIAGMLTDEGMSAAEYTWEHNYAGERPLESHLALDGQTFTDFTDDILTNPDDWPDGDYLYPGDHDGCMCDFTIDWTASSDEGAAAGDDGTGGEEELSAGEGGGETTDEATAPSDDQAALDNAADYGTFAGTWPISDLQDVQDALAPGAHGYDDWPTQSFNPRDLVAGQDVSLSKDEIADWAAHGLPPMDADEPPIVARVNGTDVVMDGNNRAAAAALRGENIDAKFIDIGNIDGLPPIAPTPELAVAEPEAAPFVMSADAEARAADMAQSVLSLSSDDSASATLASVRADMLGDIRASGEEARGNLEAMDAETIARPPPIAQGARSGGSGGEYDWYYQLSSEERDRLRNSGYISDAEHASKPDQLLADYARVSGNPDPTMDQAMGYWVEQTRIADAAQVLSSRSVVPDKLERFGGADFNWNGLAPNSDLNVQSIFATKADATKYLAGETKDAASEVASRILTSNGGPAIYDMSYADYAAELGRLDTAAETIAPTSSDAFGEVYSAADNATLARLNELLPSELADPDGTFDPYMVWLAARQIALDAGLGG